MIPVTKLGDDKYTAEVKALVEKNYYVERVGFSPLSLLKNPMILIAGFSMLIVFGMPYIMDNSTYIHLGSLIAGVQRLQPHDTLYISRFCANTYFSQWTQNSKPNSRSDKRVVVDLLVVPMVLIHCKTLMRQLGWLDLGERRVKEMLRVVEERLLDEKGGQSHDIILISGSSVTRHDNILDYDLF